MTQRRQDQQMYPDLSVQYLVSFFGCSEDLAAEAIQKRPNDPERQPVYVLRKQYEAKSLAPRKLKVTSSDGSNLIIDGEDSGQASMQFYHESHAFDALNIQNHKDCGDVRLMLNYNNRFEYQDQHTLKTYIFEKILCAA